MSKSAIETARERWQAGEAARTRREGLWSELLNFVAPTASTYEESIDGEQGASDKRERRILDSTASESAVLFSSFVLTDVFTGGNATAEALSFDPLNQNNTEARALKENFEVRAYLQEVAEAVRAALWSGEGSAAQAIQDGAFDLGWCGSCVIAAWENTGVDASEYPLLYQRYSPWQVAAELSPTGAVGPIFIKETLSNRQAKQRWPDKGVLGAGTESTEYVFMLAPATDPQAKEIFPKQIARGLPWVGGWFEFGQSRVMDDSAYHERPLFMARWANAGIKTSEVWGRSPAMVALGNIASVNALEDTSQRIVDKLGDPPFYVRDGGLLGPLRLHAGGITYGDMENPPSPLIPPGASRVDLVDKKLLEKQEQIRRAFFVHLMQGQAKEGNPITAEEYRGHERWRNRAVAPMALRLHAELYSPLVKRVVGVLSRKGYLPTLPPLLEGKRMRPKFNCAVLASQAEMDALAVQKEFELIAPWAQADASVLDNYDPDGVQKVIHRGAGSPSTILRPPAKVKQVRDDRAAAQQQQQQAATVAETLPGIAALTAAQKK